MKVLFIYTDVGIAVGYSCGIGVLSAYLKQAGHQTSLIHVAEALDYPFDLDRILADVKAFAPDLIACSAVTNQWLYVRDIARHLRAHLDTPIVVGGHHADAAPKDVLAEPAIDYACRGEGEKTLLQLVKCLGQGGDVHDIPNLVYRRNGEPVATAAECEAGCCCEGGSSASAIASDTGVESLGDGIYSNRMCRWIQNIDELPIEDLDIFDYQKIVDTRDGWAEVMATRGCPYACTYCFNRLFLEHYKEDRAQEGEVVTMRDYVRRHSVERIMQVLHHIRNTYRNVKGFVFVDDVFAIDPKWLGQLAPRYRDEIGLPFACTSQPLAFREPIAALLQNMGCKVVKMGVEAGNERIRNQVLNRNIKDQVLLRGFELARKYKLKPFAYNMIGLPTETRDDMLTTARFNAQLRPYIVWLSTFLPYPGSVLADFCEENDLIDHSRWDGVRSYRGGSVLKEKTFTYLDIEQIRVLFRWYLNAFLGRECSEEYQRNIDELLKLGPEDWLEGRAEKVFKQRDAELDDKFRKLGYDHYTNKSYVNLFWAKEYDYDMS